MPCGDHQPSGPYPVYQDSAETVRKVNVLTGALCAIFNDLEERILLDKVIETASLKGQIDLRGLYEQHKKADEKRLTATIDKFSEHEQDLLFHLLLRQRHKDNE